MLLSKILDDIAHILAHGEERVERHHHQTALEIYELISKHPVIEDDFTRPNRLALMRDYMIAHYGGLGG